MSGSQFLQNIIQTTTVASNSRTTSGGRTLKTQSQWSYPLNLKYNYVVSGATATQTADVLQTKSGSGLDQTKKRAASWSLLDTVNTSDTLTFKGGGFSPSNGKSRQQYKSLNLDGACYEKTLKSRNYVLTGTTKGC